MKKYKFVSLFIELTRRCNQACAHCGKGEAQNLSMSKAIIDKLFSDIADCKRIVIGSGEATLEMDLIEYLINKIIDSSWTTSYLEITTNGTIRDRNFVDLFEMFCQSKPGRNALIRLSIDQFHNADDYNDAATFYKTIVDEANKRLESQQKSIIRLDASSAPITRLAYSGRAIDYIDNHPEKYSAEKHNIDFPYEPNHRIRIEDNTILCQFLISANGNIGFYESISDYTTEDRCSMGNITKDSVTDIIERYNSECMMLCSEGNALHMARYLKQMDDHSHKNISFVRFYGIIANRIIELRKLARKLYPHIPASYIISQLSFPDRDGALYLLNDIYEHCPYRNEKLISKIKNGDMRKNPPAYAHIPPERSYAKFPVYYNALTNAVIMYLTDKSIERKYPYTLFGTDDEVRVLFASVGLDALESYYVAHPDEAVDCKIFTCKTEDDDKPFNIDYTLHTPKTDDEFSEKLKQVLEEDKK